MTTLIQLGTRFRSQGHVALYYRQWNNSGGATSELVGNKWDFSICTNVTIWKEGEKCRRSGCRLWGGGVEGGSAAFGFKRAVTGGDAVLEPLGDVLSYWITLFKRTIVCMVALQWRRHQLRPGHFEDERVLRSRPGQYFKYQRKPT